MNDTLASVLAARKAVVVVDMQRDYCVDGGIISSLGHDVSHFEGVAQRQAVFLAAAREFFDQVVFVRTLFPSWPRSRAQELHYRRSALARDRDPTLAEWFGVSPQAGDHVITKARYSSFRDTPLDALLRASRIETLVVMGATTDVCVDTTVRDAFQLDYTVVVASDCCGASSPARHQHALDILDGFFARVHLSDEILGALRVPTDEVN